jgi:DNA-binding transcriptional regulator YdaS (Cro superfamily)
MERTELIKLYIEHCGGRQEAAKRLGISKSMLSHLTLGIRGVSPEVAFKIDMDTSGVISRDKLVFGEMDRQRKSA